MPYKRKTEDMSLPTINRWLRIYLVEVVEKTKSGYLDEEYGRRTIKGLKYAIKALDDSLENYRRESRKEKREAFNKEYEEALKY